MIAPSKLFPRLFDKRMNRWESYGNHESVHSGYLLKRKSELYLRLKSRTVDEKLTNFSWRGNKNRGRESSLVCGNLTINLEHPYWSFGLIGATFHRRIQNRSLTIFAGCFVKSIGILIYNNNIQLFILENKRFESPIGIEIVESKVIRSCLIELIHCSRIPDDNGNSGSFDLKKTEDYEQFAFIGPKAHFPSCCSPSLRVDSGNSWPELRETERE